MDERKLTRLSLLCCTFGLVLLFFLAEHNQVAPPTAAVIKATQNSDAIISGQVIALKPLHVYKNASNEKPTKPGFILDIQTRDRVSAFVLDSDNIPLRVGDQVQVRGNIRFGGERNKYGATLLASEVRVVS
ncbi:hypothetical protein HY772_04045 [Candidatus Woesearchaeota archaeon]|nr:hypothetical protein [Candidatus Woesearchaeota archaeon]